jgi:hypothetical protein
VNKSDLRVDWATHEAAKYACEHWHYSGCLPKSKLVKIGVWELGRFIGVVMFGVGATPELCKPYKLKSNQVCELVRVALQHHETQTSRIVAMAIKMLRRSNPGLRMIVSFADSDQGHHGGIYQAGGWIYSGDSFGRYIVTNGKKEHPRTLGLRYGVGGQSIPWLRKNVDPNATVINAGAKHRYLMPLDADMRARVLPLAKPYPKRDKQAMAGDHPEQRRGSADRHAPSSSA